jgi:hypothetical protein
MTKYLYRKTMGAVTLATAIVVLSISLWAQYRAPQAERKNPRAVGVLETFRNGSRRLVPVTFFYERRYYDATFYHATPVPFTLYSETVYEVQQFGKPLGIFTVQSATQNSAEWFGNGKFKLLPDAATLARKHAPRPVVLEDPSKPVLHRREGSQGDDPTTHPVTAANTTEAEEDPDRPKMHRREGSDSGSADAAGQTPATGKATASAQASGSQPEESSGQDPDRPKLHRKDDSAGDTARAPAAAPGASRTPTAPATVAKVGAGSAELTPSEDPDHPILRRGKPVQEQSGGDLPDFKNEDPVLRQVAISDAGSSEGQSLIYVCREEERKQIEESALELAKAELQRMAAQRGITLPPPVKTPGPAKAVPSKALAAKKGAAAKVPAAPAINFEEEQFVPYDLSYNNYATVVFSGRYAPPGPPNAGTPGVSAKAKSWVVTVVARQDEGKLVKLYSAVSDPRELDLYPEVRLVDALDPDGYGRVALLFREQKRDGVSWLVGRVTGYELQTIFETPSR